MTRWVDRFLGILPALFILGMCVDSLDQPVVPQPQKIKLSKLHVLDIQLIPKVGPVLANELSLHPNETLRQIKGIGPAKESLILTYIDTSP